MLVTITILLILLIIYLIYFPVYQILDVDRIYYINLDRRPDRNEHFLNQCKKQNINSSILKRFRAIDGTTYVFTENEKIMFENADYIGTPQENKIKGNQLSHYYILREMIRNDFDYILICQDDVIFCNDFVTKLNNLMKNIPPDTEIVNIGFLKYAVNDKSLSINFDDYNESTMQCLQNINDSICILKQNVNPCSLCYIVTKKGCMNLIKHFEQNGFKYGTDYNYNTYLNSKNINYGSRIALCTANNKLGSDIYK